MPDPQDDLYAVLGVAHDASPEQIAHAFRALVRRHHPDTRASEPPRPDERTATVDHDVTVREVVAAYAILHDPRRRAAYDGERRAAARRPKPQAPNEPMADSPRPRPRTVVAGPPVILGEFGPQRTGPLRHWIVDADRYR